MKKLFLISLIIFNISIYSNSIEKRFEDPATDKNLITPTAQTLKKGSFTIYNYYILGLSLSYSFTDSLQITVGAILINPYSLSLKAKLFENNYFILSTIVGVFPHGNFDKNSVGVGGGVIFDIVPTKWLYFSFILLKGIYNDRIYYGENDEKFDMKMGSAFGCGGAVNIKIFSFLKLIFALNYQDYDTNITPNYDLGLRFYGKNLVFEFGLIGGAPIYKDDGRDENKTYSKLEPDLSGFRKLGLPYWGFIYKF